MSLSDYVSKSPKHRFGGRAGALQDSGEAAALVKELGEAYAAYHGELTDALTKLGGLPRRSEFESGGQNFDVDGYTRRGGAVDELVHAEAFLRWCSAKVAGRRVGTDQTGPLITPSAQLRSMLSGQGEDGGDPVSAVAMPDWSGRPGPTR